VIPPSDSGEPPIAVVGRYAIYDAVASGGMATVHVGRLLGAAGFHRTVAIKRLHPQYAHDKDFAAMFLDEARLAARVQHPNVVPTIDVVVDGTELLLVMEYVRGVSLSQLTRAARDSGTRLPPRVVVAILAGALYGLHAAHEAHDERGMPLELVHRDVSPQNVLVGADGIARVLDFGIAKAAGRLHQTREGEIKGKLLYMPPEQLAAEKLTRACDIYSAGIVLFEVLTNTRMFAGEQEAAAITRIIRNELRMPSEFDPELARFDAIVRKAAAADVRERYATAYEMALALEATLAPATPAEVGEWVKQLGADLLDARAKTVADVERSSTRSKPPPGSVPSQPAIDAASILAAQMGAPPSSRDAISAPVASGTYTQRQTTQRSLGVPPPPESSPSLVHTGAHPVAAAPAEGKARVGIALVIGALLALLAVACGAIAFLMFARSKAPVASAPAPSATSAPAPVPSVAPADSVTAPVVAMPVVSASAAVTATATAKPAVVKPVVAHPKMSCDPPYTIDKKGHHHFIPECVQ